MFLLDQKKSIAFEDFKVGEMYFYRVHTRDYYVLFLGIKPFNKTLWLDFATFIVYTDDVPLDLEHV